MIETTGQHQQANLHNSAVLKMLEEEEGERIYPGYKRVAWPPVSEGSTPVKGTTPQPQQTSPHHQYQPQSEQPYQQTPVGHQVYGQQPYHQQPHHQQPHQQQPYQQQPYQQQQQQHQQQQQYQQQQQHQPQYYPQAQPQQFDRGQSPGIITLRKEPPISQKPAPVYMSQPAATIFRGGSQMRGDLKWPPPDVKAQMEAEEEQRRTLARGPAVRPRRVHKDYTQFFAQHALNATYPGYKVPPGTQHVYVQF